MSTRSQNNVSISRTVSSKEDSYVSIEIYDAANEKRHRIKVSMKNFALAIMGMAEMPCEIETRVFPAKEES